VRFVRVTKLPWKKLGGVVVLIQRLCIPFGLPLRKQKKQALLHVRTPSNAAP
jgi:hypothetical protein